MLKTSKLMLMSMLWFGAYMHGAEAVSTEQESVKSEFLSMLSGLKLVSVSSVSQDDIDFVLQAYEKYQRAMEIQGADDRQIAIDYCNTLLSRFYRSQLDAIAKVAPSNFNFLKKAIAVACAGIDQIGADLINMLDIGTIDLVSEEINKLRDANTWKIALNAVGINGITALMWVCSLGYAGIVKDLLSLKDASDKVLVDVNAVDIEGYTALIRACERSDAGIVKELLSLKDASGKVLVDVNAATVHGNTALLYACYHGCAGIVQELLSLKDASGKVLVDVNAKAQYGYTGLIRACHQGRADIVKELLSLKDASGKVLVDVNVVDKDGYTALMWASIKGYADIVKALLDLKDASDKVLVDMNVKDGLGGTALIWACNKGSAGIAQELLKYRANILHANNRDESALGILHEKLADAAIFDAYKVEKIRSILKVFDALRPDLTPKKLKGMDPEVRLLKDAYVEFQKGNHQELRKVLFETPRGYETMGQGDSEKRMAMAMDKVFKLDSIRPLVKFLQPREPKQKALADLYMDEADEAIADAQ